MIKQILHTLFMRAIPMLLFVAVLSNTPAISCPSDPDSVATTGKDSLQPQQFISLIKDIERALQTGSAEDIIRHCATKLYLSLHGDGSGYFSTNQAYYILQDFFTRHKLSNVQLSPPETTNNEVYSLGNVTLYIRGKREMVKVYVGFVNSGNTYRISQLTIY